MVYFAEPLAGGRGQLRCDVVIGGEVAMSWPTGSPAPLTTVKGEERTLYLDEDIEARP